MKLPKLKKELEQTALKARESAPPAHAVSKAHEDNKPSTPPTAPAPRAESKAERKPEPKAEVRPEPKPTTQAPPASATPSASASTPAPAPTATAAPAPMPQFQPAREKMLVYPRPNNE